MTGMHDERVRARGAMTLEHGDLERDITAVFEEFQRVPVGLAKPEPLDALDRLISAARMGERSPVLSVAEDAVIEERRRQVMDEGWSADHDDGHASGELAMAAGSYAIHAGSRVRGRFVPIHWPWGNSWWKPTDRRRDLIKAAALIIAEIERLDRQALRTTPDTDNA